MLNSEIETLFTNFTVGGQTVPVTYMEAEHTNPSPDDYVTYQDITDYPALCTDDSCQVSIESYDFDIYSQTSLYPQIIEAVKNLLISNGWTWTGNQVGLKEEHYYHTTVTVEKERNQ